MPFESEQGQLNNVHLFNSTLLVAFLVEGGVGLVGVVGLQLHGSLGHSRSLTQSFNVKPFGVFVRLNIKLHSCDTAQTFSLLHCYSVFLSRCHWRPCKSEECCIVLLNRKKRYFQYIIPLQTAVIIQLLFCIMLTLIWWLVFLFNKNQMLTFWSFMVELYIISM